MIDTLINQAGQAHAAGNLQQAWQLYQQVLQQQPQHPAALGNLGIIALETGNVDAAESMLQQALAMQKYADWQAALALTLQRKGKIPDAIEAMQEAVDMDPEYALFHCRLADMYSISGEVDAAIKAYKKALHDADYAAEALYGLATLAESGDFSFDEKLQQQLTAVLATACSDNRLHRVCILPRPYCNIATAISMPLSNNTQAPTNCASSSALLGSNTMPSWNSASLS